MKPLSTQNRRRLTNLIVYPVCIAGIWCAGYISRGVPEPYVEDFPVTPGIVQSYYEAGEIVTPDTLLNHSEIKVQSFQVPCTDCLTHFNNVNKWNLDKTDPVYLEVVDYNNRFDMDYKPKSIFNRLDSIAAEGGHIRP